MLILAYKSQSVTGYYHEDMNKGNFIK